jgi:hypothetical protein
LPDAQNALHAFDHRPRFMPSYRPCGVDDIVPQPDPAQNLFTIHNDISGRGPVQKLSQRHRPPNVLAKLKLK